METMHEWEKTALPYQTAIGPDDESYPECEGCDALLYDDEAIETQNGETLCGDCVAIEIQEGLKGQIVIYAGIIDEKQTFKLEQMK